MSSFLTIVGLGIVTLMTASGTSIVDCSQPNGATANMICNDASLRGSLAYIEDGHRQMLVDAETEKKREAIKRDQDAFAGRLALCDQMQSQKDRAQCVKLRLGGRVSKLQQILGTTP